MEVAQRRSANFAPSLNPRLNRKLTQTFNDVFRRLREMNVPEARLPGFQEELRAHFDSLPLRYARVAGVRRAQDVLMHKRIVQEARNPATIGPVVEVRLVELLSPSIDRNRVAENERLLKHEVIISIIDRHGRLTQLTRLLGDLGLNIYEAHAFSTIDGYFLGVFCVDGWLPEEATKLKKVLVEEISIFEDRPN